MKSGIRRFFCFFLKVTHDPKMLSSLNASKLQKSKLFVNFICYSDILITDSRDDKKGHITKLDTLSLILPKKIDEIINKGRKKINFSWFKLKKNLI